MEMVLIIDNLVKLRNKVFSFDLVRDTINTTLWSIAGKAVGFLIPFFIAAWFGISSQTDAFFFGYSLIMLLVTIFSPVLESIIVPFIAETRIKGENVGLFVGNVLGVSAIGLFLLSLLFLLFIKPILSVFTNFSPSGLNLVYLILIESSPLVILLVWTSILAGTLNAYKVFSIPAISPAFRAIVTLIFIFLFKKNLGVHAIALGYVVGEIFRLFILFTLLKRLNIFHLKLSVSWGAKIAGFLKTSSYQIMGMSAVAFTSIINRAMASWLGLGKVSLLEYAERLYLIPENLLATGLIVTLLSHWSERYCSDGEERLKRDVWKAVKVVGIGSLLLTTMFLWIKNFLVSSVYRYGQFPQEQIANVQIVFGFYLLGLAPHFLTLVYVRAFLTKKDTKVILLTAFLSFIATIVFNLIFMRLMGISGIALTNSIVAFLSLGILCFLFYRK